MSIKKILLVILLFLMIGCTTMQEKNYVCTDDNELVKHQIYINKYGKLVNPLTRKIISNEDDYIKCIIDNIEREKKQKLLVFIHGGLNTFTRANKRVSETKDDIMKIGDKYPIYISWDSNIFYNYIDHLFFIRQGNRPPLGWTASPFVLSEDFLRSVARIPASTYNTLYGRNALLKTIFSKEKNIIDNYLNKLTLQGFNIHNNLNKTRSKIYNEDWLSALNPIKVILSPIVDGLGTGTWNSMLRRTDLVLRKDPIDIKGNDKDSTTAVTKFFNAYTKRLSSTSIDLVGHSMGTIISNNILSKYGDETKLHFENIVYMAAACSIKDLEFVVAPYLERNIKSHFYALSLNHYRDLTEENFLKGSVPRGSVLIWIDKILGNINSFQDKTAGLWFNLVQGASSSFKGDNVRSRVHLTQFGINDASPQNHNDFDNDNFWRKIFWTGEMFK